MGISHYDPAARGRPAWNAGKQIGAKRALKPRQIWAIRFFLDREGRMRDRALFDLAIDSKLRGCDLLVRCLLDVGQLPALVEERLLRPVETGEHFEAPVGVCGNPV